MPLRPTIMRECLRLSDEFLQADNHGSRTPRLAAVAEEESSLLECMKALLQTVLQQGQALQQMQQQQLLQQQQQMLQMQSYAQMAATASTAAPAPRNRQQNKGCYQCGGPHFKIDCPQLRSVFSPTAAQTAAPTAAPATQTTAPTAVPGLIRTQAAVNQTAENFQGPTQ